jgi:hypothetical protein
VTLAVGQCIPASQLSTSFSSTSGVQAVFTGTSAVVNVYGNTGCTGASQTIGPVTNGVCTQVAIPGLGTGDVKLSWSSTACPSSSVCFHEDTLITYNGAELSLTQLERHPECSIPHIVHAVGSIVTAMCGASEPKVLRLTSGHLLYTQRGLQAAGDITTSDTVFSDTAERIPCHVVKIAKETSVQKYFGLNCLTSQVLASGIKASTFEKLHSIPSFWMAVMGRVLGIKRASEAGDYINEIVMKLNIV